MALAELNIVDADDTNRVKVGDGTDDTLRNLNRLLTTETVFHEQSGDTTPEGFADVIDLVNLINEKHPGYYAHWLHICQVIDTVSFTFRELIAQQSILTHSARSPFVSVQNYERIVQAVHFSGESLARGKVAIETSQGRITTDAYVYYGRSIFQEWAKGLYFDARYKPAFDRINSYFMVAFQPPYREFDPVEFGKGLAFMIMNNTQYLKHAYEIIHLLNYLEKRITRYDYPWLKSDLVDRAVGHQTLNLILNMYKRMIVEAVIALPQEVTRNQPPLPFES